MESTHTPQVFEYRKSTQRLYKLAIVLLFLSCAIIVRMELLKVLREETLWAILKLAIACGVPLSIFIRLHLVVRPRIFSRYELYDDKIVKIFKRNRSEIAFSQIKEIKISMLSPRFLGGFSILTESGQKYYFLSALKDSHLILEKILKARPELLGAEQFQRYRAASQLVNMSWRRLREKMMDWRWLFVKYLVAPSLLALFFYFLGFFIHAENPISVIIFNLFLIAFIICIGFGWAGNSLEERLILEKYKSTNSFEEGSRDKSYEKRIAHIINGLFFGVILGSIGLLFILS